MRSQAKIIVPSAGRIERDNGCSHFGWKMTGCAPRFAPRLLVSKGDARGWHTLPLKIENCSRSKARS